MIKSYSLNNVIGNFKLINAKNEKCIIDEILVHLLYINNRTWSKNDDITDVTQLFTRTTKQLVNVEIYREASTPFTYERKVNSQMRL